MAAPRPFTSCAVALLLLAVVVGVSYGSPDPLGKSGGLRSPRFIPSSSGRYPFSNLLQNRASFLSTGSLLPASSELGRPKRALFDDSCKGAYDREIFAKLDRVCEDCYNLYRKTSVSYECRRNCFQTTVFRECVLSLMLPLHRYTNFAHRLYTKHHKKHHHHAYTPYTTNSVNDIHWYRHSSNGNKGNHNNKRGITVDNIVEII